MTNENQKRKAIARLSICTAACLGTTALSAFLPEAIAAGALGAILEATKSVLPGNVANALDAATQGKEPDRFSLANEDLARAAGRAIGQIIRDVAEDKSNGYDRRTRRDLGKIADGAEENWVAIARRETSEERYRELMERNLDELLTAEGKSFAKETAMTPEAWGDVFAILNMAAHKKSQYQFDAAVGETIAQQLHTNFPKALREALKDDFQKDGKAFAGLVLSLLTDIKREVATLKLSEAELVAVNERLGEIIDRLNAGEREQQAFFREIANNFEKIEKMANQIDDLHQTLHRPPLTREQWRELCRQMLLEQLQLRTNAFTNRAGVSPIINDVYVPLALVERREKPQVKPNSPAAESPERMETEEQLVPVSEEEFLREVLRLGQSKSQGKRIAVVGEPGSGKTTRLQFIADWILREDLGLPVWVSLADLGDKNISSFLEQKWKHPLPGVKVEFEQLTAQAKDIWLLLDGLDEMTARIEMGHVEKLLEGWVAPARVIISCRTNVWEADRNAFSGFDVFRNLEFASAQVEAYIRKWFGAMEQPGVGEELLAELAQSPNQRLRDLIGNPLRLWMLCQIWQPEVGLPATQAQLYGEFVDWVYDWRVEDEIGERREEIDRALGELALAAMEREESSRSRLPEKWVREQLKDRWIFKAVERLGWLNVVSREGREAVYGFYHLTFLEYFAALAVPGWGFFLSHVPGKPERGVYRIFAREWKQVILLWLGRDDVDVGEKEEFVRALVEFDDGCGEWNFEDVDRGFYGYRAYFLAAAGISEFRERSLAGEIVEKIVRWGFGYFDEEIQEWVTYLNPIEEEAREILKDTIRDRAIARLEEIMATASDRDIRLEAAECLGQIVGGHEIAIAVLIKMMATTSKSYRYKRRFAARCLEEIARGNEKAIAALIEIMVSTNNEDTQRLVAKCLGEIADGNQKAIVALEELLATSSSTSIRQEAAESLGKISSENETAIAALADLLLTGTGLFTKGKAARGLGKIAVGNHKAMTALIEIMGTIADEEILSTKGWGLLLSFKNTFDLVAASLKKIAPGNEKAIVALEELLANSSSEFARRLAAECLGEIAPGNQKAIVVIEELLATRTWEYNRLLGAESLEKIAPGNEKAIVALEELLATTDDEVIRREAASILGKILPGHEKAIAALTEIMTTTTNELTRSEAAKYLGQIVPGSQKAIAALIEIMTTTIYHRTCSDAAWNLQNILKTNEQYCQVVSKLKHHLSNETYQTNYYLFNDCYTLIWQCAQNLTYPEFYRGWHGHNPDDANQTPQTFDPQQLNRALQQRQLGDTVQPYYIDGSQFVNPDNPAPEIYHEMLDQNSPQRTQGEPANMQEFKLYWKQQCRQGKPILIFYEDPQPPAPQGFSETFLLALSRCGGSICVLKEGEAPPGLPTFSPADPDLIEKLVEWIIDN